MEELCNLDNSAAAGGTSAAPLARVPRGPAAMLRPCLDNSCTGPCAACQVEPQ
jgi:hypothetical protein